MKRYCAVKLLAIVSDSHALLRKSVLDALAGCDLIIHAGDVGSRVLLERLEEIAPLIAVRGNIDHELADLPETELVSVNQQLIYVLHDLHLLDLNPVVAGIGVVVSGHSHQPRIEKKAGILYVNPGSIGPRRFKLPISFAEIRFDRPESAVRLVYLEN